MRNFILLIIFLSLLEPTILTSLNILARSRFSAMSEDLFTGLSI